MHVKFLSMQRQACNKRLVGGTDAFEANGRSLLLLFFVQNFVYTYSWFSACRRLNFYILGCFTLKNYSIFSKRINFFLFFIYQRLLLLNFMRCGRSATRSAAGTSLSLVTRGRPGRPPPLDGSLIVLRRHGDRGGRVDAGQARRATGRGRAGWAGSAGRPALRLGGFTVAEHLLEPEADGVGGLAALFEQEEDDAVLHERAEDEEDTDDEVEIDGVQTG